jgi:membrane associated rhomboid family serine protease
MIQRVQTLFLLAASALLFTMFFGTMVTSAQESVMYNQVTPLLIMNIVTFSMAFVSIFLYKQRVIQIRVSVFNSVILLAFQGWILWMFFNCPQGSAFSVSALFPLVAAILSIIAMRYIARDEAIVRSTSRLRNSGRVRK